MSDKAFKLSILIFAGIFLAAFLFYVAPAALIGGDPLASIPAAFAAGFVNPFAAGYSIDVIMCWCIMSAWILYERKNYGFKHGPLCIVLGVIPGVAVGFALYLYLRNGQSQEPIKGMNV